MAGTAGALAFATGSTGTLIGVMVAVALMPPLVAFGMLGGAGQWADALQALTLLLTTRICVNLASIGTFLFHGICPSSSKWRDQRRARFVARLSLLIWALALGMLLLLHLIFS